jgi:hypothetical protein
VRLAALFTGALRFGSAGGSSPSHPNICTIYYIGEGDCFTKLLSWSRGHPSVTFISLCEILAAMFVEG